MNHLLFLIPAALFLGFIGLLAFLWSLKSGQYDDLDGAAWRILNDESDSAPVRQGENSDAERKNSVRSGVT